MPLCITAHFINLAFFIFTILEFKVVIANGPGYEIARIKLKISLQEVNYAGLHLL